MSQLKFPLNIHNLSEVEINKSISSFVTERPFTSIAVTFTIFRYFLHYYKHGTFKQFLPIKFKQATEENLYNKIAIYWQGNYVGDCINNAIEYFSNPINGNYNENIIKYFADSIINAAEEPENHYLMPYYTKNIFITAFSMDVFKYILQFFDLKPISFIVNICDISYQYLLQFANYSKLEHYNLYTAVKVNPSQIEDSHYIKLVFMDFYKNYDSEKEFCTYFNSTYNTVKQVYYANKYKIKFPNQWIKELLGDLLKKPEANICIKKLFLSVNKDLLLNTINEPGEGLLRIKTDIFNMYKELIKGTQDEEKAFYIGSYFEDCHEKNNLETFVSFYYNIFRENIDLLIEYHQEFMTWFHRKLLEESVNNSNSFLLNGLICIAIFDMDTNIVFDIFWEYKQAKLLMTSMQITLSKLQGFFTYIDDIYPEELLANDHSYLSKQLELVKKSKEVFFTSIDIILEHKDILFKYEQKGMYEVVSSLLHSDNSIFIDFAHRLLDDVGGAFYNAYNKSTFLSGLVSIEILVSYVACHNIFMLKSYNKNPENLIKDYDFCIERIEVELKASKEKMAEANINLMIQYFSNQTIREQFYFFSVTKVSFLNMAKILSANRDLFFTYDKKWYEKVVKFFKIGYQKGFLEFDKLTANYLLEFTDCEMLEWQNESTLLNHNNITTSSSKDRIVASDENSYMEESKKDMLLSQSEIPLNLELY